MNPLRLPQFAALLVFLIASARAQDPFAAIPQTPKSEHAFLSEVTKFKPGEPFYVALKLTHPEGLHSYYINPGTIGQPPVIEWELPEGWQASEIIFPVPHRTESLGEPIYGYEDTNYFFVRLTPPSDAPPGTEAKLVAKANWQICDESCYFEPGPFPSSFLDLPLDLTAAETIEKSPAFDEIQKAKADLPRATDAWSISLLPAGKNILIDLTPKDQNATAELAGVTFFSEQEITDAKSEQKLEKTDTGYRLTVPKKPASEIETPVELKDLAGILVADSGWEKDEPNKAITLAGASVGEVDPSTLYEDLPIGKLLVVLAGMFVGGLILNLMPCVFPVIGLKIMGFVSQAGSDRRKIIVHGLVFALGVLISFWVLAGILLTLRETALAGGGDEVGWGYQLQNPWVVWATLLVMFVLGLNMYGVFEIGASATGVGDELQSKHGLAGSFFSGVLATVVATPCSAPFLGVAIGAAFQLPSAKFMLAFTFMALGLAAPYLLLSAFPALLKKLPSPGPWMVSFKQAMSFLLFGTAGFLTWVYLAQVETFHGLSVLLGLSVIALAFWVYGRWNVPSRTAKARGVALLFSVLFLAGGLYASRPVLETTVPWEDWSPEKVEEALADGRPVYVDFTAKWCLTCQLNKGRAYTSEVVREFGDKNVLMLRADKTKANPAIEAALRELKRTAIPVNVLYEPGKDPVITDTILSPSHLQDLLKDLPNR